MERCLGVGCGHLLDLIHGDSGVAFRCGIREDVGFVFQDRWEWDSELIV